MKFLVFLSKVIVDPEQTGTLDPVRVLVVKIEEFAKIQIMVKA